MSKEIFCVYTPVGIFLENVRRGARSAVFMGWCNGLVLTSGRILRTRDIN